MKLPLGLLAEGDLIRSKSICILPCSPALAVTLVLYGVVRTLGGPLVSSSLGVRFRG
jgi:hypothetical protein